MIKPLTYLQHLESESIYIIREVVAEFENPAMLYSIGKDSAVLLHLLQKAFYPAIPPLPLVHVDTKWKFKEMIAFRDKRAREVGMELIVYTNSKGEELNISPFTHGSSMHTDIMKTQALRQMLNMYRFDAIFGGARRDEEKSRAKERIYSCQARCYVPCYDVSHCFVSLSPSGSQIHLHKACQLKYFFII